MFVISVKYTCIYTCSVYVYIHILSGLFQAFIIVIDEYRNNANKTSKRFV